MTLQINNNCILAIWLFYHIHIFYEFVILSLQLVFVKLLVLFFLNTVPPKLQQEIDLDFQTTFSVTQGHSITLPCSVTADPPASITWLKSGSKIELTDVRYLIRNDGALEIFGAEVSDGGQFKCVASNSAGKVNKDVTLFVQGWSLRLRQFLLKQQRAWFNLHCFLILAQFIFNKLYFYGICFLNT